MEDKIDKIENHLITASITILGAEVVVYSSNNTNVNLFFSISASLSVFFLSMCFLMILYGKYRQTLRKTLFKTNEEKWNKDQDKLWNEYANNFLAPQLVKIAKGIIEDKNNVEIFSKNPEKIKLALEQEWEKQKGEFDLPRKLFVENQVLKFNNIMDNAYGGPLKEKYSIVKYQCESFATKKYTFFVLGLLAFIFSVIAKLFI